MWYLTYSDDNRYLEHWTENGHLHLAMEFCPEGDLRQYMIKRNGKPFAHSRVFNWTCQLAGALKYCHDRDIIHRDLKVSWSHIQPEINLILSPKIFFCPDKVNDWSLGISELLQWCKILQRLLWHAAVHRTIWPLNFLKTVSSINANSC